jgi:hypothetical protein
VGEEEVGAAGGAEIGDLNAGGAQSGATKLIECRSYEVKVRCGRAMRLVTGRLRKKERQRIACGPHRGRTRWGGFTKELFAAREAPAESGDNFFAHLVAAGANARSEGGEQVVWV